MAIFGNDFIGTDLHTTQSNRALVDRFTLTELAEVTGIFIHFTSATAVGTSFKGIIFSDDGAGEPDERLIVGSGVAVPTTGGWLQSIATGLLEPGDYWIGWTTNSFQGRSTHELDGGIPPDTRMASGGTFNYTTPPATWPGTTTSYDSILSAYVEYDPPVGTTPRFVGAGAQTSGSTAPLSLAYPLVAADDLALLIVEASVTSGSGPTLSTPSGFTQVDSNVDSGDISTTGTRLQVYAATLGSSSPTSPTLDCTGCDHVSARILVFRGAGAALITATDTKPTASTSVTCPAVTTAAEDSLIVNIVSRANDSSGAAFSAQANASLTVIRERHDDGSITGNGGGVGVWTGIKTGAGSSGSTTATVTSSINAMMTIALSAASSDMVGTTTVTLAASGTLQAVGGLSGASSLAFGASATVSAAGALQGAASLALACEGSLTGAAALQGSSAIAFAPAGTLAGAGALAGSASIAFGVAGALLQGDIAGAASLSFDAAGELTGAGALAGTTGLAFTPSGDLVASGALQGAAAVAFEAAGAIQGTAPLEGAATLTFDASGDAAGAGALSGQTGIAFSAAINNAADGQISGTASLTFATTAEISGAGAAVGATALTLAAAGELAGSLPAAGSAGITFGTTGAVVGLAGLAGSSAIEFSATATGQLAAAAIGNAILSLAATGSLVGAGSLAATTGISFQAYLLNFAATGHPPIIAVRPEADTGPVLRSDIITGAVERESGGVVIAVRP